MPVVTVTLDGPGLIEGPTKQESETQDQVRRQHALDVFGIGKSVMFGIGVLNVCSSSAAEW